MPNHPELESEQHYVDRAYRLLEDARRSANRLRTMVEVGAGGTAQARFERDVIYQTVDDRLAGLDLGDASLVFGRIDVDDPTTDDPSYYIGRLPVSDESHEAIVVDWRAPIAEAFYRATGPHPMGLTRRRHFASRGRTLVDIDDEYFGIGAPAPPTDGPQVSGRRALVSALETSRTGRLGDVVGTIQIEQDRIIRSELPGILVVQGGPGTGKTVVALHRAAYLLYTHRFPLDGQGVLVVGPNRLFLSYIEQVLPSLGEAGVELAVLADLIDPVSVSGADTAEVARIKGDSVMVELVAQAVTDRRRSLRTTLRVPYGLQTLTVEPHRTATIVRSASQRFRTHNAARRFVETSLFEALAESSRSAPLSAEVVAERLADDHRVRAALEWMWPVLTPGELLHDLYGSPALLRHAGRGVLPPESAEKLHRPWSDNVHDVLWTLSDVPLLDEAATHLGPNPRLKGRLRPDGTAQGEIRTWGHIVVDEAQDLSPMQLRMLARRSLNGSMTVVGDIAQATGAWAHADWYEVLDHLPDRRGRRITELTIGYRIPRPLMRFAARVLRAVAPDLTPPGAVRPDGDEPIVVGVDAEKLAESVANTVRTEIEAVGQGNVAVIVPASLTDQIDAGLTGFGVAHGNASANGLAQQVTVVPVRLVKGLEVDAAIVVEPMAIIGEESQGERALYVALTRATKRLTVIHTGELPAVLRGD